MIRRVNLLSVFSARPAFCCAALLLAGCSSTATLAPPPTIEAGSGWQSELPAGVVVAEQSGDLGGWWQQLQDPLLNQLIELTLQNSPDIESARINYRLARLEQGVAGADNKPAVVASTGASREGTSGDMETGYSAGLTASWELDLWGNIASQRTAAQAGVDQASEALHDAQVSLIAETATAYTNLRLAQENIRVAQASIDIRRASYDMARFEYEAGLSTELAVMQAKTLLDQSRAELPSYRKDEAEAINQLTALAGGGNSGLLPQLRQPAALPALPQQAVVSLPADILRQRPDVKAQEFAVIQQAEAVTQAENSRYPSFTLTGKLTGQDDHYADVFDVDNMIRSLAASLSYTLFDSGVLKKKAQEEQLALDTALNTYRSTLLTARQEAEDALSALTSAQRQQEAYEQARASAAMAEELARFQYDAGLLDFTDLLDTQSELLSAETSLAENKGTLLNSWIQLYRTVGGGWQGLESSTTADYQGEQE